MVERFARGDIYQKKKRAKDRILIKGLYIEFTLLYRLLVSLVGKAPVRCAGGSGSILGRTTTQGLKIIEEKVLPLL